MLFGDPEKKRQREENAVSFRKLSEEILEAELVLDKQHARLLEIEETHNSQAAAHRALMAPKWEYLLVSSDELGDGGLGAFGALGWELVGISSYETGGGSGFTNSYKYTVKIMFAFKRPFVSPPSEVAEQREKSISEVRTLMAELENRISGLKKQRNAVPS